MVARVQAMMGSRASNVYLTTGDAVTSKVMSHHIPIVQICEVTGCSKQMKYVCRKADCKKTVCANHGQAHGKHSGPEIVWREPATEPAVNRTGPPSTTPSESNSTPTNSSTATNNISNTNTTNTVTPTIPSAPSATVCVIAECNEKAEIRCEDQACGIYVCTLHGPRHSQHQGHILSSTVASTYDEIVADRLEAAKAKRQKKRNKAKTT